MILKEIMDNDMDNCDRIMRKDSVLKEIEKELYGILNELDDEVGIKIEELISAFTARSVRLTYMQGIKDFKEMFVTLDMRTEEIIRDMEKKIVEERDRL